MPPEEVTALTRKRRSQRFDEQIAQDLPVYDDAYDDDAAYDDERYAEDDLDPACSVSAL